MKTKVLLALLLVLQSANLSVAQANNKGIEQSRSSVGLYLKTVAHDVKGNLWVGGSVWLLQGLLLRINSAGVKVITPPQIQTVQRLLFTTERIAWMIADHRNVYKSIDGGNTWRKVLTDRDSNLEDITFSSRRFGWVVGWDGIVYHTKDGGEIWEKQRSGTEINLNRVVFVDDSHGWAMGWNILDSRTQTWPPALIATADGGRSWKDISSPTLSLRNIAFVNRQEGWGIDAEHNWRIVHTDDGGLTWKPQGNIKQFGWESVFFINEREGWAVGDEIIHTTNGGKTWEQQRVPKKTFAYSRISFAGFMNGGAIRVGAMHTSRDGDIVRTRDGGRHWRVVANTWVRATTDRVYREQFPGLAPGSK